MERIIIRHISGSRANQVEEFPIKHVKELSIGRDPASTIKFDPDRDEMVSRHHAKIIQDELDEMKFTVTDLDSRNGTYVNNVKIDGSATISPGAVIQLGPKGPQFEFDLEPRPTGVLKTTRLYTTSTIGPPVEEQEPSFVSSAAVSEQPRTLGTRTLEFVTGRVRSDTRKSLINISAALLGIVVLVGGGLWYLSSKQVQVAREETRAQIEEAKKRTETLETKLADKSPAEIAQKYGPATVFIEASWKLVNVSDGNDVCHLNVNTTNGYNTIPDKKKKGAFIKEPIIERVPVYVKLKTGSIEPLLTTKIAAFCRDREKIGDIIKGTGFVVNPDGFILTNRHIAAMWYTSHYDPLDPGIICSMTTEKEQNDFKELEARYLKDPRIVEGTDLGDFYKRKCPSIKEDELQKVRQNWVPVYSEQLGGQTLRTKFLDGRHEYLNVKFPNTNISLKAHLVNVSEVADVALIKVDVARPLDTVELSTEDKSIKQGDPVTVLGYPDVSPEIVSKRQSQDPFNPGTVRTNIPNPTITNGLIGKIMLSSEVYYSEIGDAYQVNINTGQGNSGGPVIDRRGQVIGIFTFWRQKGEDKIYFAVPIQSGRDLMDVKQPRK